MNPRWRMMLYRRGWKHGASGMPPNERWSAYGLYLGAYRRGVQARLAADKESIELTGYKPGKRQRR